MKIKLKWEFIIISFLSIFMIFVIYVSFFLTNIKSQLISDKYYEDEIKYQEIINEKKNTLKLLKKINFSITPKGLLILFPISNCYGYITLFRLSSKDLDFTINFNLIKNSKNIVFIPKKKFKKGYYKCVIRFFHQKKRFFFEKDLFWK